MTSHRLIASSLAAFAVVLLISGSSAPASAQKTIAGSFQQQIGASGANPNSVYGGYQTSSLESQGQSSLVAPVQQQRRTQQTYINRQQQTEFIPRQPVYQKQQISSSSSVFEQQAEADAEPASYGKLHSLFLPFPPPLFLHVYIDQITLDQLMDSRLTLFLPANFRLGQRTARSRLSGLHSCPQNQLLLRGTSLRLRNVCR